MIQQNPQGQEQEVDIAEFAKHGKEPPNEGVFKVLIGGEEKRIRDPKPTGKELLGLVGKKPCSHELIAVFKHREDQVVDPEEHFDVRQKGLEGFLVPHKETVTIFFDEDRKPRQIERGHRTVKQILEKDGGKTPEAYILLEEKNQAIVPVPVERGVEIHGCEQFFTQVNDGSSS